MRKSYPSDLTDEQAQIILPLIPVRKVGRPREVDAREVLDTSFYRLRSGCRWDMLPHDLLPRGTVDDDFAQWRDDSTGQAIHGRLASAGPQEHWQGAEPECPLGPAGWS